MSITDNLLLKVQPAAGDTYVKNLVVTEDVAASGAGAIALVDDAGLKGWQITGVRQGVFTGGVGYEGSTFTFAARFKINSRAANYLHYLSVLDAASGGALGPHISNNGTATGALNLRESLSGGGFNNIGTPAYTTGQYITIVMRFYEGAAGAGTLDVFLKQASRATNNPDYAVVRPASTTPAGRGVLNNLFFGSAGTDLTVVDLAFWTRGLTNAEAAAIADDLRTTINAVPAATVPAAPSLGIATAGNAQATFPFTVNSDGGSVILDTTVTLSPGGATGTYTGSGSGSITVTGLANGTAYTATAKSRNSVGPSSASTVSNSVTPTASNAVPTFPGPNIADIAGTVGVAITPVDVSTRFADSGDTKAFSKSGAGTTWPNGLSVDINTGIVSGTPTSAGNTTGCKVRDTDSAGQVVDSNAFAFNIAAPVTGSFVSSPWINNADTPWPAGTAVKWTWIVGGRVGAITGKNVIEGSGTLGAGGVLTITGLPAGAGRLDGAVQGASPSADSVYQEYGTVA